MKKNKAILVIDGSAVTEEPKKEKRYTGAVKLCAIVMAAVVLAGTVLWGLTTGYSASAMETITADEVVNYMNSKVGSSYAKSMCLAFVADSWKAMGFTRSSACCASKYGNSYIDSASIDNIPLGADVFFGNCGGGPCKNCGSATYGHVGVYVGDGYFVHATGGKVHKTSLNKEYWRTRYRGWGWHGNVKVAESAPAVTQPPPAPTVSLSKTMLMVGEQATLTWSDCPTATYYWASGWTETRQDISQKCSGGSLAVSFDESGWHSITVVSGNDAGESVGNWVSFYVYNTAPEAPSVNLSKTMLKVGEQATLTWSDCPTALYYMATCWTAEEQVFSLWGENGALETSFDKPGTYYAAVTAGNSFGETTSGVIEFVVYENDPTGAWLWQDKTVAQVGSEISFNYNAENAVRYVLRIEKDGELYNQVSTDSDWWKQRFDESGVYTACAVCSNSAGESASNTNTFVIYDDKPYDAWAWSDSREIDVGQSISFNYNAIGATGFTLGIDRNGVRVDTVETDSDWYTASFDQPGVYSFYATCHNSYGYEDSPVISFTVRASLDGNYPADLGTDFYAYIKHQSTGRYMTNRQENIMGEKATGESDQVWKFIRTDNGSYVIESASDGGCIDVLGSGREDGTRVYVYSDGYVGGANQRFFVYDIYDAYYLTPEYMSGAKMLDMGLDTYRMELWGTGGDWAPQEFDIEVVNYTLTYDANGGSGAPDTGNKFYNSTISVDGGIPTRDGYEFIGWNTERDGSGTGCAAGDNYTGNADLVLYAQWETLEKDIPFNLTMLGGSARLCEPYGLRFGVQLIKDDVYREYKNRIVSYGTLVISEDLLNGGELTLDTPYAKVVPADMLYSSDESQLTYTGVVTDIPKSAFQSEITGRGYLVYLDESGGERVIYTEQISRSYYSVVQSAYERYSSMENRSAEEQLICETLEKLLDDMLFGDNLIDY